MPRKPTQNKPLSRSSIITLIVYAVCLTILLLLSNDTRDRIPTQPWLPPPDINRDFTPSQQKRLQRTLDLPWERYENTDLYNEFIEHLDEKGILEDEPDAIDIWEKYFE
jgi:hypothetical protein